MLFGPDGILSSHDRDRTHFKLVPPKMATLEAFHIVARPPASLIATIQTSVHRFYNLMYS